MKTDCDEFERTREFKLGGESERSDQEHPEQAYRRGVQQGAYFVLEVHSSRFEGKSKNGRATIGRRPV